MVTNDILIDIGRAARDLAIQAHVEARKIEMPDDTWEFMLTQRDIQPLRPYGGKVFGIPVVIDNSMEPGDFRITYRRRIGI